MLFHSKVRQNIIGEKADQIRIKLVVERKTYIIYVTRIQIPIQ